MIKEREIVDKKDAILYADIQCCGCGKLMAFSNAVRLLGHYYCPSCKQDSRFNTIGTIAGGFLNIHPTPSAKEDKDVT